MQAQTTSRHTIPRTLMLASLLLCPLVGTVVATEARLEAAAPGGAADRINSDADALLLPPGNTGLCADSPPATAKACLKVNAVTNTYPVENPLTWNGPITEIAGTIDIYSFPVPYLAPATVTIFCLVITSPVPSNPCADHGGARVSTYLLILDETAYGPPGSVAATVKICDATLSLLVLGVGHPGITGLPVPC